MGTDVYKRQAYVVTVLCNLLFEATRLGGTTSGEVANLMYVWFMPAGYVFSIWGLIYVALIVWLVQYTRCLLYTSRCV